ncbi:uncharacterized protein F5147DRAFT_576382 [Suillus discolor]|uniref:CxC1-like cysteine cluster associated with KDZ transposases domain-containing protein n=1 Tax=Suillus discolor TaxID=1912936 RepID=A0A9P7F7D9_9AGAM|nr:uncharacterized protein F5147DRAFT_576382 [Suillus discolor]KAG2108919.1 hypothetical protein F5147DRAFT_576382 [Suillus discolor]
MPHNPLEEPALDNDSLSLKNIELIDVFSRKRTSLRPLLSHTYPNKTLIYHGYLDCLPLYPTVAVSICTLATYRQSHRTWPRFSIQAQCKALCHLHNIRYTICSIPYQSYLNTQFSDAYDVYLEIIHRVDSLINEALDCNTPNWHLLNSCPCCFYKLEDEDNLTFEWLVTINSNNSLKRWSSSIDGSTTRGDLRKFRTDYWLDHTIVDGFKDDVRGRLNTATNNDDWQDIVPPNESAPPFTCIDRWRNAGPEQCKQMFAIFDESGIFIAACRHQFVLLACDMVKSGELAKYPLAIIERLLTVYGQNGACAYDISCAFAKTLANSMLGQRASSLNLRMMVGAFHGHAHNQ